VQLSAPGGRSTAMRALAAYLYCGVTAVRSAGDPPGLVQPLESAVSGGERLGAEAFETQTSAYMPMLVAIEAATDLETGNPELLNRPLFQQVGPPELIRSTRKMLDAARLQSPGKQDSKLRDAMDNLLNAYRAGTVLVAGSGAGSPMVFHGPGIQRELELWVQAGIPPRDALLAATANAARLLDRQSRIGTIRKGNDADLLLVDGNPLEDITALERVSDVIFKGERIDRTTLFEQQ
jgi:hypothetical protein